MDVPRLRTVFRASTDRLGRVVVQSQKMDLVPQVETAQDLERANLPTAVGWARKARTQPQNFQSFRHAWSRAQQAVTLLGPLSSPVAVTDEAARDAAHLTLAEVCFTLCIRNTRLAIMDAIGRVHRARPLRIVSRCWGSWPMSLPGTRATSNLGS
jgi:hypothetical protein